MPYFCSIKLEGWEKAELARQGEKMLKCWLQSKPGEIISNDSKDLPLPNYMTLPYLCPDDLIHFYSCLDPLAKLVNGFQLMSKILFDNQYRNQMCWLDLMAYLCARGEKPKNYHYID